MAKMDKERFSLLLLEPGEYYFEDFSVFLEPEKQDSLEDLQFGRLRVCSKSLVFDPKNNSDPIIKIPLKDCVDIKSDKGRVDSNQRIIVDCSSFVEMLEGNVLAPYTFKSLRRKFYFTLLYAKVDDCLPHISQLLRASSLPIAEQNQMIAAIAYARQCRVKFKPIWLEDMFEKIVLETIGNKITPLVVNPGRIVLSSSNLYFQPFNNMEPHDVLKIPLSDISRIIRRRFLLQQVGIEIYCKETCSVKHLYLSFKTCGARDTLYNCLLDQPELRLSHADQEVMTLQWQSGALSNYDYLLYLNSLADRNFNDLTQYPVFPWVIADYTSTKLDLKNPKSFRDLTKPIGALNPERLSRLKERYNEMPNPKFLYGSHYSTPGFVLFYLVRKYPHYMLCLQNGRFDHPDRMFNSIPDMWRNVLTNMSDFKELVPEFYDSSQEGDFLENRFGIHFGYRHDGSRVNDVALPPWASGPKDFVTKLRSALESDYVSAHLHHWIDLIFGYKQTGVEAEKANNLFYYLCYEGAVDLESITDWNQRHALEVQIMEFGQIPKKVFSVPHPPRSTTNISSITSNITPCPGITQANGYWGSVETLKPCLKALTHREAVTSTALTSDARLVLSVGRDTVLKMTNVASGKLERSIILSSMTLSSVIILPDDLTVIVGSWDSTIIVYDIKCARTIDTIHGHEDAVSCIGWNQERKILITGSWDCSVRIWQAQYPWSPIKAASTRLANLDHDSRVKCLSICETLVASGTEDGELFLWSLDSFRLVKELPSHFAAVNDICFSPDETKLISCSNDQWFKVFDLSSGLEVYAKMLEQELMCLAWDGLNLLIGDTIGALYVFDLKTATIKDKIEAHKEAILTLAASPCKPVVVSGGEDHRVIIWDRIIAH
nr:PREDICTED: protein FAN-like [Bemisia tabaci]